MSKYFLLLCALLLSIGCQRDPSSQQVIRFAVAQAPLNLDPRYATDAASERVNRLLYESLVDFDEASAPVPRLATWKMISAKEYVFRLSASRASFHNQARVTATDVAATYQSILSLKDSAHAAEYANIAQINVLNEDTVSFRLKRADKHFPAKLIIGILPKSLIDQRHDFAHYPIGSGALKFVDWHNKLTLQRVRDGQIITLQEVKDPTVRVLKLMRSEADLLQGDLPTELVNYLQNQDEISVKTIAGANFSYLGLNMHDPILKNIKVRQAIAHAIDRQAIIDSVMVKSSRLAGAILPPEHWAGNPNLKIYAYDPALSKRLLQEANVQLPLKLVYKTSTDAQRVRFATILQAQMRSAGIQMEISSLDWGTFFEDVKRGSFQVFGLTWVGIKTPEIYTKVFGSQYIPPKGFNRGRYADSELDKLLALEDWLAATARIHSQLPYIPLWYEGQFAAMRKGITGYSLKSDGNWDNLMTIKRSDTITAYAH